jgi:hypothetical protein
MGAAITFSLQIARNGHIRLGNTAVVRPVRLLLLPVFLLAAFAVAAVASAAKPGPVEDGTLSVRDGRAMIQLRMKGGLIGRFGQGKLTVSDSPTDTSTVVVRGAERTRELNERTTVYSGKNIRFRIADDDRIVVKIQASKINLSAVGRGDGALDGWGNRAEGVYFDGSYSLNGDEYKSLPDHRTQIDLAAPPTTG